MQQKNYVPRWRDISPAEDPADSLFRQDNPVPLAPRGHRIDLGVYGQIEYFFVSAKLDGRRDVDQQFEVGASIGTVEPLRLKFFDLPRLSAGYRFGDGVSGVQVRIGGRF